MNTAAFHFVPVGHDPFAAGEITRIIHPLETQQEIWLACAMGGDDANCAYNESISLDMEGPLDVPALQRAFEMVILRHEALRCTFSADGKHLFIAEHGAAPLRYEDLSYMDEAAQKRFLMELIESDARQPFDLQNGPLFRGALFRLAEDHHMLKLTAHHIVCDGWSFGIIMEELASLYSAEVQGIHPALSPPDSFSQYCSEMEAYSDEKTYRETERYWAEKLTPVPSPLTLPTVRQRPLQRTYASRRDDFPVDASLTSSLKQLGARCGASFVNTLLVAFEVYLNRLTGQSDIVVGLPTAGQAATGHFNMVGHCVNLLPLRSSVNPATTFVDHLIKRKTELLDDYDHQQYTYGSLLKVLKIKRDRARVPLIPVVFNIDIGMDSRVAFPGIRHRLLSNPRVFENFELSVNATSTAESIVLEWSYNTHLFDAATIRRMMMDFEGMLADIAGTPDIRIDELKLRSAGVRNRPGDAMPTSQMWVSGEKTQYPRDKPFFDWISRIAEHTPDRTALVSGNQQWSYQDLEHRSNRLAHYLLHQKSISRGDVVAVAIERSAEMVMTLLAVAKTGAAYLPLDLEYPADRVAFMVSDADVKLLITQQRHASAFGKVAPTLCIDAITNELTAMPHTATGVDIKGDDLVYLIYTSGSTGRPKGVAIKHHSLVNTLLSGQHMPGIKPEDVFMAVATVAFDAAALELFLPLISGAKVLVADRTAAKDARILLKHIEIEKVTILDATPATWRMLLDAGLEKKKGLKALCAGEALPRDLADKLLERCETVWNIYGPTETTIFCTAKRLVAGETDLITVGTPIANTSIYILDDELNFLPAGEVGQIFISGDGIAQGYYRNPALTAERFLPDILDPARKMYASGDLGKILENGEIACLGRIDHQVKIRGYRIELGEIEYHLMNQRGIKEAVVTAREDTPGDRRLVAYFVPESAAGNRAQTVSWKDRWESIYEHGKAFEASHNGSAHNLDVTIVEQLGPVIPDVEAQEVDWLSDVTERVTRLAPKTVMEIGCGAGHLMFELASHTKAYIATDYAAAAIASLQEALQASPHSWPHVQAHVATAGDFSCLNGLTPDLILLHSVVQYFPSGDYLFDVIRESLKHIATGGCIFLGDLQGKNTLPIHHAADQLYRTGEHVSIADFKAIVSKRLLLEDELTIDPGFFYGLPRLLPRITGVDVQLRKGSFVNETTKYHYDVWLYVETGHRICRPDISERWTSAERAHEFLSAHPGEVLAITEIPDSRTAVDLSITNWLDRLKDEDSVKSLKERVSTTPPFGVTPNLLWELAETHGYTAHVRWSDDGTDGIFEAVFLPGSMEKALPPPPVRTDVDCPVSQFVRDPDIDAAVSTDQLARWKESLRKVLPEYMVPSDWVALRRFPLTANNKIDRNALPKPKRQEKPVSAPAKTQTQSRLAKIWKEVLALDQIDIKDDFFELGGHSLIAVKMMVLIEQAFNKRLPLSTLFEHTTIERLANFLDDELAQANWKCLVPIKPSGKKPPIYVVHGAGLNVLLFSALSQYMDSEQPIYGLQARGLNGEDEPFHSIEEMAAHYVTEILSHNPDGPFFLAGYSLGGIIAYEMAQQLISQGKNVRLLAMLDTFADNGPRYTRATQKTLWKVMDTLKRIGYSLYMLAKDPQDTFVYKWKNIRRLAKQRYWSLTGKADEVVGVFGYLNKIDKINAQALRNYQLSPIDLHIDVLRATTQRFYAPDLKYLGWRQYGRQGVTVYDIPGDHNKIFKPPYHQVLSRKLQEIINEKLANDSGNRSL
jgi:amino acid adenylation domain